MTTRKQLNRNPAPAHQAVDFGLLSGKQSIGGASGSLRPVPRLPAASIHPVPTNPRYPELCDARIIQPWIDEDSSRHLSSTHINKLSLRRTHEWIRKVKNGWLKSAAGEAWLAEEGRAGHTFNFESPSEEELANIWRARCRRWFERVSRMLMRATPDAATSKRWAAITGADPSSFVRTPLDSDARARASEILFQWGELLALSTNIAKDGLGSPVVVRPVVNGFEIVAGERRYWACCLASMDHIPCVGNEVDVKKALSRTIHENLDRVDIALRSQVRAMRTYVEMETGQPCGPSNKKIKISFFETEYAGRSRSWCHRWRVICLLPEGCDVLQNIYNKQYSSINEVDTVARAFLKELKARDKGPGAGEDEEESNKAPASTDEPPAPLTPTTPPQKPAEPLSRAKVRLPGTEAGKRILSALKSTEGLKAESLAAIETALKGWPAAPEGQRKKYLESVIDLMATELDYLDEVDN